MEKEVAKRRINLISAHFAPTVITGGDAFATDVSIMSCRSNLSPVARRFDSRTYFARQGSEHQACFMNQRNLSLPDTPLKLSIPAHEDLCMNSESPIFSRPARSKSNFPNVSFEQHDKQPPQFARPCSVIERKQLVPSMNSWGLESHGLEWSPRMDVAESGRTYSVTVELPGISINEIRVEVNDQNLVVAGKRSTPSWKAVSFSNDSISTYHKREITQGQYQIVWPLPADVNKDTVSAEFKDGILQIVIPKM